MRELRALSKGLIKKSYIHAEIGEILIGKRQGRETDDEITIFDSTGLAVQDIAAMNIVYQITKKRKIGERIKLL